MEKINFALQLFAGEVPVKGTISLKPEGATKGKQNDGIHEEPVKTADGTAYLIARNNTSANVTISYDREKDFGVVSFKATTGKIKRGQFIEIQKGSENDREQNQIIRYYAIGDDGKMFKRVEGTWNVEEGTWTFVPKDGTDLYLQTKSARAAVVNEDFGKEKAVYWAFDKKLDFSKESSAVYYSLSDGYKSNADESTLVSRENSNKNIEIRKQKEANKKAGKKEKMHVNHGLERAMYKSEDGTEKFKPDADEVYLEVKSTKEANGFSKLTVNAAYVDAYGNMKTNPAGDKRTVNDVWWKGSVTVSGKKAETGDYKDKYATIDFDKSSKGSWHITVEDAAVGSTFNGLRAGDFIDTAATGDDAVALQAGTHHVIYNMTEKKVGKKLVPFQETRTLTVDGSDVRVKTDADGKITSLTGIGKAGDKVTLVEKTVTGQLTKNYEYAEDGIIVTTFNAKGKKIDCYRLINAKDSEDVINSNVEKAIIIGSEQLKAGHTSVAVGTGEQAKNIESVNSTEISVKAVGNGKYTISDINDGEAFNYGEAKYTRYKNSLFTAGEDDAHRRVYNLGTGKAKSITGDKLNLNDEKTAKLWKKYAEVNDENVVENISLAQVAKKETAAEMSFIHDRFIVAGKEKASRKTTLVETAKVNADFQHQAGTVNTTNKTYDATSATAGQKITAASGWTVKAGQYDDTIIGAVAVRGKDEYTTYNAGAGTNTIKLGTAKEKVIVGTEGSKDTITGYASGKDEILVGAEGKGDWKYLVKGKDLYITNAQEDLNTVEKNQHAMLKGAAVSTKSVTINEKEYYFGSVKFDVDKTTKTAVANAKQSNNFIYKADAYYMGNELTTAEAYNTAKERSQTGLDTLKVQEVAAKNDQVNINLTDSHYVSIDAVDASGMKAAKGVKAKEYADYSGVNVTAGNNGLRFTGSKFSDTVTCGAKADYIITGTKQGKDVVNNFGVGDTIQLNGLKQKDITSLSKLTNADLKAELASKYGLTVNLAAGTEGLSFSKNKITATATSAN